MIRTAAIVVLSLSLSGLPAYAGEKNEEAAAPIAIDARDASLTALTPNVQWTLPSAEPATTKRPAALPALYISLAALQAFDAYSTTQGLSRGAREANPVMQGVAGQPAALWAVKAATTAIPMVLAERMWRTNRVGAVVAMVLANSVAATVAANNARVLRQQR